MNDDFSWTNNYYQPEEELLYFMVCLDCTWASDTEYNDFDLVHVDTCPCCGSGEIVIESDHFQK